MLDIGLVVFTVIVALLLRTDPLRRLKPLTTPLLVTAAAALAHFLAGAFDSDPAYQRGAEVTLLLALGFLVARGSLILVFDWILVRRMGVRPPRLAREVVALVVYVVLGVVLLRSLDIEVTGLIATSAVHSTV